MEIPPIEHRIDYIEPEQICALCIKARVIDMARYARITLEPEISSTMTYADLINYGKQHYQSKVKCYNCIVASEQQNDEKEKLIQALENE